MAPSLKEGIGSEASLTVPDFNISLHGSSCNYVFFSLIPVTLLPFLNIGISNAEWETKNWTEKEKNREYDQNRELHELLFLSRLYICDGPSKGQPSTSGKIRLGTPFLYCI